MDTKKLYLLGYGVLAIISLAVVGVLVYRAYNFDLRTRQNVATATQQAVKATLLIDFGNNKTATYSATLNSSPTVLDLVNSVSSSNPNLKITLEQKPLGTLLKSINGVVAENGYFWFVYVGNVLVPGSLGDQKLTDGATALIRYQKL